MDTFAIIYVSTLTTGKNSFSMDGVDIFSVNFCLFLQSSFEMAAITFRLSLIAACHL